MQSEHPPKQLGWSKGGLLVTTKTLENTTEVEKSQNNLPVTMRELLEAGVHFGHQTRRWNPKMKRYIFTERNDIHVIDLQQTIKLIKVAYDFVLDIVSNKGTVLFVGTKKQAQEAIKTEAERCQMPYVNQRWLGGTLTNSVTIRQSINKLKKLEKEESEGLFETLSKKESSKRRKKQSKLNFYLGGIKNMGALPKAIFIVDTKKEQLVIKEAQRLNIPIIGLVDTNADPTEVQYPIPGNDDAIRAVKLICSVIAKAVENGTINAAEATAANQPETPQKETENDNHSK